MKLRYSFILTALLLALSGSAGFAQVEGSEVSGHVIDEFGDPLVGATVRLVGTTTGTITDVDGNFTVVGDASQGISVSYIGYELLNISGADAAAGALQDIILAESAAGLEEVVVTGTMDIVRDRRTPVAVSTIGLAEIQAKGGNVEFPDLMKATPSVYVTNQAGGFGEAQVFTRGFDQTNTAFLLNGQPINGMEDGQMYWSNWSGMTDVATAVQIQRGLGSSKLAISSVGGTTNIVMKSTESEQGGSFAYTLGNDGYNKFTGSYSTGLINDKFGMTVLLTHWQGNGWADGTRGQGQNYFVSAGYKPTPDHDFNFILTGAPQYHDQNFNTRLSSYEDPDGDLNVKYNANWGYRNGEYYSIRRNYYHKPVANLNWDWTLTPNSSLSTVLYGSWGRGGGSGPIANPSNENPNFRNTADGLIDFDFIEQSNRDSAGSAEYVVRNSVNNHSWYGLVSRYETKLADQLDFSVGADFRTYRGSHFREVRDLLGAPGYSQGGTNRYDAREVTTEFPAKPWAALNNFAAQSEQIDYSNDERITYIGGFTQLEYTLEQLSVYVQAALSNQSHIRYELFRETESNEESEKITNVGYNVKGGLSYQLDEAGSNIVFGNVGYYSRQPYHDNVFLNFSNTVNPVTQNEDVFGLELGYKLSYGPVTANVNAYRTSWRNRTTTRTIPDGDTIASIVFPRGGFTNFTNVDQLHQGLELDFRYRASDLVTVKGFASYGDWKYDGNAISNSYDDQRALVSSTEALVLDGVHVGGSAQTTAGLGVIVEPIDRLRINVDAYHNDRLYSNVNGSDRDGVDGRGDGVADELELPGFTLVDLGAGYLFSLRDDYRLSLRANLYNVFGTEYIAQASSAIAASEDSSLNYDGVNKRNFVQFGTTQTWNLSAKLYF